MGRLGIATIILLFVFLAGAAFTWWTPDSSAIGFAYVIAAILILIDALAPVGLSLGRRTAAPSQPPA